MKIASILCTLSVGVFLSSCATTSPQKNKSESAVPKTEVVELVPEVQESTKEEEIPVVSEDVSQEIRELRDSVEQKDKEKIYVNAHKIIDSGINGKDAVEALRALALLSIQDEKYLEAQLYLDSASNMLSNDYDNMMLSAQVLHLQKKDDEAVKVLKHVSELFPKSAAPYVLSASILLEYLDVERALDAASKAFEISPSSCDSMIVYADALYASKQFEKSVSVYEAAHQQCAVNENVIKNIAKIYEVHVQNPQKSCSYYQILTEMVPTNAYYKASKDYQCGL